MVYVESRLTSDELASLLAGLLPGAGVDGSVGRTVRTRYGEIDIRKNKEADPRRARDFPDGFLHFRYVLEIYPLPTAPRHERTALASKILQHFWSEGMPAVAACDNERELPRQGGYNDHSAPWPAAAGDAPGTTASTRAVSKLSGDGDSSGANGGPARSAGSGEVHKRS
jgi:hypothetical protein